MGWAGFSVFLTSLRIFKGSIGGLDLMGPLKF